MQCFFCRGPSISHSRAPGHSAAFGFPTCRARHRAGRGAGGGAPAVPASAQQPGARGLLRGGVPGTSDGSRPWETVAISTGNGLVYVPTVFFFRGIRYSCHACRWELCWKLMLRSFCFLFFFLGGGGPPLARRGGLSIIVGKTWSMNVLL